MKNYKLILVVLTIGFCMSCEADFLNPAPESAISGANFPSDEDELQFVLNSIYDEVKGVNSLEITDNNLNHGVQKEFYITEMLTDNTRSKSGEGEASQSDFYTIVSTNGFVFDYYRSMYAVIYRANLTLANINLAETNAGQIEAEARFLRAYAYFNLVRAFGDIPLVLETIGLDDTDVQFTRVASSEVYEAIIADFQFAIANLGDDTSYYRATVPAAQAFLAKVYLTLGTDYGAAQSLLEEIINSEAFVLEPDFRDVFFKETGNTETIFTVGYLASDAFNSQDFSAEMLNSVGRTSGQNYVTNNMIAVMNEFGGNRTQYSFRVDPAQITQTQVIKYLPTGDEDLGIPETSPSPRLAGNDFIEMRYADVLLMHVEAILAGGESTTATNAITSFQLVRDRAGLTDPVVEITKDDLLLERRVELAFENHRMNDLKRFGVAQEVLSAFSAEIGGAFSGTDLLLPIPQFEINLSNGALAQNPGY